MRVGFFWLTGLNRFLCVYGLKRLRLTHYTSPNNFIFEYLISMSSVITKT